MNTPTYCVTFAGEMVAGADPNQVKVGMAKLFKLDPSQSEHLSKLKRMFSGRTIIIKDKLTLDQADKYQQAIMQVGAVSRIEPSPIVELRKDQRRKLSERRAVRRTSAILPDRRENNGRREED